MGLFSLTRRVGRDAAVAVTGGGAAATGAAEGAVNGATQGASHARGSGPRSVLSGIRHERATPLARVPPSCSPMCARCWLRWRSPRGLRGWRVGATRAC